MFSDADHFPLGRKLNTTSIGHLLASRTLLTICGGTKLDPTLRQSAILGSTASGMPSVVPEIWSRFCATWMKPEEPEVAPVETML